MERNALHATARHAASFTASPSARLSTGHSRTTQAGIALVEVLIAIFIMGIGLLALLTLFPLGAIEMAQAIPDDRTAAAAGDAVAFAEAGKELISRTTDFVRASIADGSADRETAARLREDYEYLADQAERLELQLEELQSTFPRAEIQPYLSRLLAQLRWIKWRIVAEVRLLSLLESVEPSQLPGT